MDISILDNPLYSPSEKYRLKFTFSTSYPIEAPEVVFLSTPDRNIPMHPHVYSNGIICLDLLDSQGWSPVHNVESVCISIQSMLASNTKAESKSSCLVGLLRSVLGMRRGCGCGSKADGLFSFLLQDHQATRSLCARTSPDRGISTSSTTTRQYSRRSNKRRYGQRKGRICFFFSESKK
jgi:hypothetical protein